MDEQDKIDKWDSLLQELNILHALTPFAKRGIYSAEDLTPWLSQPQRIARMGQLSIEQVQLLLSHIQKREAQATKSNITTQATDEKNHTVDSSLPSVVPTPEAQAQPDEKRCQSCGRIIKVLLYDNHIRHCRRSHESPASKVSKATPAETQKVASPSPVLKDEVLPCQYCGRSWSLAEFEDHEYACGIQMKICNKCQRRDTQANFHDGKHVCPETSQNVPSVSSSIVASPKIDFDIGFMNDAVSERDIPKFERCLYQLEQILYRTTNFGNIAEHTQTHDLHGHRKPTHIIEKDKFEKYHHKHRRSENQKKYFDVLNLLKKVLSNILKDPDAKKFRILKCKNKKLKEMIFAFGPACEYLRLCGFEYIEAYDSYILQVGNQSLLLMGRGVLEAKITHSEDKHISNQISSEKWEKTTAYGKGEIFKNAWACKYCNHLNRRSKLSCAQCRKKRLHDKKKIPEEQLNLNTRRWICLHCDARNSWDLFECDNCKRIKAVKLPKQSTPQDIYASSKSPSQEPFERRSHKRPSNKRKRIGNNRKHRNQNRGNGTHHWDSGQRTGSSFDLAAEPTHDVYGRTNTTSARTPEIMYGDDFAWEDFTDDSDQD